MGDQKSGRVHSPEFRAKIAQRILAGESVTALAVEFSLPRSMMYRWRDAYRQGGPAALNKPIGRPPGIGRKKVKPPVSGHSGIEQKLRQEIAELQQKIGQQAVEIDFFKRVFKRLDELPKVCQRGGDASTPKSRD